MSEASSSKRPAPGPYSNGVWRRASFYWLEKTLALARADVGELEADEARRGEARVGVAQLGELAETLDALEGGMAELRAQLAQRDAQVKQLEHVVSAQRRHAPERLPARSPAEAEPHLAALGALRAQLEAEREQHARALAHARAEARAELAAQAARCELLQAQLGAAVGERRKAEAALSRLAVLSQGVSAALEVHEARRAEQDERAAAQSALDAVATRLRPRAAQAGGGPALPGPGAEGAAAPDELLPVQERVAAALAESEGLGLDELVAMRAAERVRQAERRWRLEHVRAQGLAGQVRALEQQLRRQARATPMLLAARGGGRPGAADAEPQWAHPLPGAFQGPAQPPSAAWGHHGDGRVPPALVLLPAALG